jgi:hypothetical protein
MSQNKFSITIKTGMLLVFVAIKFWLQYHLLSPEYELQRDEFLHLDMAHHLAWGYLSVPPVTSWISLFIYYLGNSIFWIKFFPALFGALTIIVVWKAIETLNGNVFALVLGATAVLLSALLRLNTLYQPNSLDVLCWTTVYFFLIRYIKTENTNYLFGGALIVALGFLNKYNIVFMLIGLAPAILMTRHRSIFLRRELYFAMLLFLLLIMPNLVWQYSNDFPVIRHLAILTEKQLVNVDRLSFLQSQVMFFLGSVFILAAALYALVWYKPFENYTVFFWAMVFTLLVFLYFRAKDYYAMGIYPIYIAFGSVFLEDFLNKGWKRFLKPIAIAIPILLFIPMYQVVFPNRSPEYIAANEQHYKALGLLRWEDGKDYELPQDFADMLGWKELAQKVDEAYSALPDPENTLVLCDNYGQAGAINYYTNQKISAVSFNADYINWFDLNRPYTNLIRVKEFSENDDELSITGPYFESSSETGSVTNPYAREFGTNIFIFKGAKVDINKIIRKEIEPRRAIH